jgi:hypothetical protein
VRVGFRRYSLKMLAYTDLTELFNDCSQTRTALPANDIDFISKPSSLNCCRSKTAPCFAQFEDVRAQHDGGVKTPRDERRGDFMGRIVRPPYLTLLCQSTHNLLVPVEPVSSWCPISRSQYNWEEEVSHQLKGEPRNAVCLDGIHHDDDSPNAASSDAARASCPCEIR